jgi:hypothetical protein
MFLWEDTKTLISSKKIIFVELQGFSMKLKQRYELKVLNTYLMKEKQRKEILFTSIHHMILYPRPQISRATTRILSVETCNMCLLKHFANLIVEGVK